jgi:hypothetical protein
MRPRESLGNSHRSLTGEPAVASGPNPSRRKATDMARDEAYRKAEEKIEKARQSRAKEPELGAKTAESLLKGVEKFTDRLDEDDGPDLPTTASPAAGVPRRAHGAILRHLQALLKEKDPGSGGLVRVQNKRQEFLWVHPIFEKEY